MSNPVTCNTTTDTLDRMWDLLHRRRAGTKQVTVAVDDLIALLNDHAAFSAVVKTTN